MINKSAQKGFTIVELLIVIVVIGILAAIMIVAYNGITNRTRDTAVKSDLANIAKKLEAYKAVNGLYPANPAELDAADLKVSQGNYLTNRNNFYYCRTADYAQYAIGAGVTTGTSYYMINGSVKSTSSFNWATTCNQLSPAGNGGSTGYDWPGDGAGSGWGAWTQ